MTESPKDETNLCQQFQDILKLNTEKAPFDSPENPFATKYEIREKSEKIRKIIEKNEKISENDRQVHCAFVDYYQSVNFIETEEGAHGRKLLENVIETLTNIGSQRNTIVLTIQAQNQLGISFAELDLFERSGPLFLASEQLIRQWKDKNAEPPFMLEEILEPSKDEDADRKRQTAFESLETETIFLVAQYYEKTGNKKESADYVTSTLLRQLDAATMDPLEWSMHAAALSQYYLGEAEFYNARCCLAAAECVLKREEVKAATREPINYEDPLKRSRADLCRCWCKLGIALLDESKQRLIEERTPGNDWKRDQTIKFPLETKEFEKILSVEPVLVFEQARTVFLCIQRWINEAKSFFILEDYATDFTQLCQDHSRAFNHLAFFEPSVDRQCKMQKRRLDMLQLVVDRLHHVNYAMIVRQLLFELGETLVAMVDLKISQFEQPPSSHAVKKVNQLAQRGIDTFTRFLENMFDLDTKKLPDKFAPENVRPALIAWFHLGRLKGKIVVTGTEQRLRLMKESIDYFSEMTHYCQRHPDARSLVREEIGVAEEFVTLLPAKMDKIRSEMT